MIINTIQEYLLNELLQVLGIEIGSFCLLTHYLS